MNLQLMEQNSAEWWALKVGKIGGTRFGKVISKRENNLIYDMMDEVLSNQVAFDDYVSDDMQYGIDNESEALRLYALQTGNKIDRVGAIMSDTHPDIHMASPDGLVLDKGIAVEVKCTMNGDIHIRRIFEGVDDKYLPQCINYFAVSDEIKEVHFVSYCGHRTERPLHIVKLYRSGFEKEIAAGRVKIAAVQKELADKLEEYNF